MTNEEKKEYLNLKLAFETSPFKNESEYKEKYISMIPHTLYKYRGFDDYTVDMIENEYLYLAPAGTLDDPFDCLTDANLKDLYNSTTKTPTKELVEALVSNILKHQHTNEIDGQQIIDIVYKSCADGIMQNGLIENELKKMQTIDTEQIKVFMAWLATNQKSITNISSVKEFQGLLSQLIPSKERIGVCSLSAKRDSKPMWSLYGDRYRGYCIEYDNPFTAEVLSILYPVIYTNEFDNSITKTIIKFIIETSMRFISEGRMKTEMGCIYELLCTKDSDWSYQEEWRLNGNSKAKIKALNIKNIYLGFDVTKENENTICELATKKGFGVYKMNAPTSTKRMTYTKLV